ncbi:hypothetical protein BW39_04580 [Delftia sp. RIT313]|nr:hypothetical protein BW39_04580 [Delftia sp. RIT313]
MVHDDGQHMHIVGQPEQAHAQQRPGAEIEGLAGQLRAARLQQGLLAGGCRLAKVLLHEVRLGLCQHALVGKALPVHVEHRAQRLVRADQCLETLAQRSGVERTAQLQRRADVVGRTGRLHAPEQPLAQLRIGQGKAVLRRCLGTRRNRQLPHVHAAFSHLAIDQALLLGRQQGEFARNAVELVLCHGAISKPSMKDSSAASGRLSDRTCCSLRPWAIWDSTGWRSA